MVQTWCSHFCDFTQFLRRNDRKSSIFAYVHPISYLHQITTPHQVINRWKKWWTVNIRTFYRSFNENTSFFLISVHFYSFFLVSVHLHSFFLVSVHFYIIFTVSVHLFDCPPFFKRIFNLVWCSVPGAPNFFFNSFFLSSHFHQFSTFFLISVHFYFYSQKP